ncbi:hypothetical protein Tco_1368032 [Tanacetum coccineum]
MVPRAVLMKSGLVSLNTARQVNTAHTKTRVNGASPMLNFSKTTHLTVKRSIHKNTAFKSSNSNQRVNTVRGNNVNTTRPKVVVNTVKGNNVNAVKALACNQQQDLQEKGVIDSECSRHMTRNMSYLTDFEEIDGGYVAFGVCACARYQVNLKVSHLHAVKRIFRYLKGQLKLGLWYPKDSPFDLVAYTDSDYAGASLDRKSTTRGCQFRGCRLISWQCKKQTVVANSTTEAEYVVASSCCGQVL